MCILLCTELVFGLWTRKKIQIYIKNYFDKKEFIIFLFDLN